MDAGPDVVDAAPDVVDAAPDVVDAMPDVNDAAPDVVDAATGCPTGTVTVVASGACMACPAVPDSGTAGAGGTAGSGGTAGTAGTGGTGGSVPGLDGGDPYSPYVACQTLSGATTSYDPATHILTVKFDYQLQLDQVDYDFDLYLQDSDGGSSIQNFTGTVPLVDNTLSVDITSALASGVTVTGLYLNNLVVHDACGRTSTYDGLDCSNPVLGLLQSDAGVWTASCGPNPNC